MNYDCIIVGAGFCGSVIARKLAEYNKKVLILERRNHIAGNMYDERDPSGILIQKYGPHIFHTNNKQVYEIITKYDTWIDYLHQPAVEINGKITPSPANFTTIDMLYDPEEADILKKKLHTYYYGQKTVTILELLDCDDIIIKQYAEKLYEMNYKPYTAKQWGIPPEEIDSSILKRVPVRLDYINSYFDDVYQCMPKDGYTNFFNKLLAHENIKIKLNTDVKYLLRIEKDEKKIIFENKEIFIPVVFTGALDELLDYKYGKLPYRSVHFDFQIKNLDSFQEASVIAYPSVDGYTRITEFKKLPPQNISGISIVAYEFPLIADNNNEPYYPILTNDNISLYNKYLFEIKKVPNLFLCGRLADFKYYNMDTAIIRALNIFEELIQKYEE